MLYTDRKNSEEFPLLGQGKPREYEVPENQKRRKTGP